MTTSTTYCHNHPARETGLRCNRCDQYICAACAVRTPAGYRCKTCIRQQNKVFDTAQAQDFVLAFVVAGALSYIGSMLIGILGWFTIFLSPMAGMVIAEAVRRVTNRRRSKSLFQTAVAGVVLGGLPRVFPYVLYMIFGGGFQGLFGVLWPILYIFLAATTMYTRLSGIQIRY